MFNSNRKKQFVAVDLSSFGKKKKKIKLLYCFGNDAIGKEKTKEWEKNFVNNNRETVSKGEIFEISGST